MIVYDNRSLFSDYYLKERLSDHKEWSEDISATFEAARRLYHEKQDILDGLNEAQTEAEFIQPLLHDVLGFEFIVQTSATKQGQRNRPDYALFTSSQARTEAHQLREQQEAFYARAAAVADAKYWGRPLDHKVDDSRDDLSNTNPSFQIVNYLVATDVDWGVLTNGQLWRLYYARARSRIDTYFEVDLQRILESDDLDAFRYFYLFFRTAAFERDPQTDQSFLESVYEGSVTYGTELEARLKDLIFEQIFIHLATGFLEYQRTNGDVPVETEENLNEIYQGTLRLLYRLLFLLHAEARALLPMDDRHGYYRYSLTRIKREVAERLDRGETLSTVSDDIWNDLAGLFRIIDRGDSALNVPRYNGGLFRQDNPNNAFLNDHRMADAYLAPALDLLTRERDLETGQHRFIDYKTLNVEQLGSIYEGLLEFHLRIADQDLAVTKSKGVEIYKPVEEVEKPLKVIQKGKLYLENDKGQRKATGSYYTPHYIVQYIVENTLRPVLEERADRFRELMAEIEPRRERLREIEANLADDRDQADAWVSRWQNEAQGLHWELQPLEKDAFDVLLSIRVCDPAMGSGHFLVYVTDWLAEHLITVLNEFPENPVLSRIADIRERIVKTLIQQEIRVNPEQLKDTNLLKRMVMKRCIYGVDLNPMATELAKLSLWLDSFTMGAPLSFLDHHLKVGNSLIGVKVEEVRQALEAEGTGQIHMFGGPFAGMLTATSLMRDVAGLTDATFEEVEQSAEKYDAFEEAMLPYKRVLDLWVSRHFGNKRAEEFLRFYGQDALKAVVDEDIDLAPEYQKTVDKVRALWRDRRFFHWELEFPEVFIDLERATWKENPGFDTVMGNPPWGASLSKPEQSYLWQSFDSSRATLDSFAMFTEQSIAVLRTRGRLGYIVPSGWQTGKSYTPFRKLILKTSALSRIVNLPYDVFPDAYVDSTIVVGEKRIAIEDASEIITDTVKVLTFKRREKLNQIDNNDPRSNTLDCAAWFSDELDPNDEYAFLSFLSKVELSIAQKVAGCSTSMGKIADIQRGITPFHLKDRKIEETYELGLDGELRRYYYKFSGKKFVKYDKSIAEYKPPRYFRGPRIILRELISRQFQLQAVVVNEDFVTNKSHQSILLQNCDYSLGYLLAILNSNVLSHYHIRSSAIAIRDDFPKIVLDETRNLPVRRIDFTTPVDERERLLKKSQHLYGICMDKGDPDCVTGFVEYQLSQEPERADVVHDLLAWLAEQMIEMHKQKQEEIKGFLHWLEREMGTELENLSGHTIIEEYYDIEGGLDELLDRLSRNTRKIPKLDTRGRQAQELVAKEYEASMDILRPLLARIERTDRLIDLIVYRLYGLTEDEIAIVEGRVE
ncbi:MAG: Eco57I restriction-modification methylase domain-containing protein [Candidatus Bipolaricaulia bacterium]